ncbi:MAG: McrC family protein [Proteobacteria bacterium]|nr:McrC family protein [Pseudomonadota bacterium]MBU1648352.1 McrC family protein [Pseudomonadota bacterium]
MKRIVIPEYGQIVRWARKAAPPEATERIVYLEEPLYRRLEKSEQYLTRDGKAVFTWYKDYVQAQQWVGIVQVPGLQVEILPKVDNPTEAAVSVNGGSWRESRSNLLYMLAVAGDIPIRSRDVARLATRRAPLNETLSALFANQLMSELLLGCERSYVSYEENLRSFKGRLLVGKQLLKNAAHRERFFCRYDQFSQNTAMNRIFKAACRVLLDATSTPGTQDALRHCLLVFDEVSDEIIGPAHFKMVTFTRQNERFEDLFHFCRLILGERAPTVSSGEARSFSLLFDMNKVFERFIAAFLHERVMPMLPDCRLYPQARHNRRPLFQDEGLKGVLNLSPDILICHKERACNLVIDTKWKNLRQSGLSDGDLYQLHAYTHRYGCGQSMLLYPQVTGIPTRDLYLLDEKHQKTGRRVSVRFVNMHRDLYKTNEREVLAFELEQLIREGIGLGLGGTA